MSKSLKDWKKEAHNHFDELWKKPRAIYGVRDARKKAYGWMQNKMKLSKDGAHISRLDKDQCKKLIFEVKLHRFLSRSGGKKYRYGK